MKYIIDIPDDGQCKYIYNEDTKELKFPCPRLDPNSFMGLDITISVSGVTPYTEPDRKAIEDEVWEFASMLMNMHHDVAGDIYWSMNGGKGIGVAAEMTYQEAKAMYEAWKKQKEDEATMKEVTALAEKIGIHKLYSMVKEIRGE